jgi:anti-sigma regulatory factor (Ser/Thr protein kinase)
VNNRVQQHSRIEPVELKINSDPANLASAREAVERLCRAAGFDDRAVGEVGLCVNEAHANVIRHAYDNASDRPIEIRAAFDGVQVIVTIRDWGNGVNPLDLPPGKRDPLTPGGLGLVCMEKMLDEARFEPQPDGMLLTLKRKRSRTQAA